MGWRSRLFHGKIPWNFDIVNNWNFLEITDIIRKLYISFGILRTLSSISCLYGTWDAQLQNKGQKECGGPSWVSMFQVFRCHQKYLCGILWWSRCSAQRNRTESISQKKKSLNHTSKCDRRSEKLGFLRCCSSSPWCSRRNPTPCLLSHQSWVMNVFSNKKTQNVRCFDLKKHRTTDYFLNATKVARKAQIEANIFQSFPFQGDWAGPKNFLKTNTSVQQKQKMYLMLPDSTLLSHAAQWSNCGRSGTQSFFSSVCQSWSSFCYAIQLLPFKASLHNWCIPSWTILNKYLRLGFVLSHEAIHFLMC